MWRSIAGAKSRHFCRVFYSIYTQKVDKARLQNQFSRFHVMPGLHLHHRLFSSSINPSQELGNNGETQMKNTASATDIHGEVRQSNGLFTENGDFGNESSVSGEKGQDQMQSSIHADHEHELPENALEEKAHETDREQLFDTLLSLLEGRVDGLDFSLDGLDLGMHQDLLVKVLETPGLLAEYLIKFFEWTIHNPGFRMTTRVMEALVLAVCSGNIRRSDAYALWDLIKEVGQKDHALLNADVLNVVICCFSKLGKGKAAFEVFNHFGDFGCTPSAETYYLTIEALCRRSFTDWACTVCRKMIDAGVLPEREQVGNIISWFCKDEKAEEAFLVLELAKQGKNKYPPQSSVDALVNSLSKKDETISLALGVLADYSAEARKHAIKLFSCVIRGFCRLKNANKAKMILLDMISYGPPPSNAVFNSIISAFSKAGDMSEAKDVMKLMERQGLKPDVYTYTVVISGFAKRGQMEEANEVFSEAKSKHSRLSPAMCHSLIRGYCKLEEFDKALKLFDEMKDSGVQPNADEYSKLIQSLCLKALDWERAEKLLQEMKGKGLQLNGITGGLISAVKDLDLESVGNENLATEV